MCEHNVDCDLPSMKIFGSRCCARCFGWFWTKEDEEHYWFKKNPDRRYIKIKLREYQAKEYATKERWRKEDRIKKEKLKNGHVMLEDGNIYYEEDIIQGRTGLNGTLWHSGYRPDDERRLSWHKQREDEE